MKSLKLFLLKVRYLFCFISKERYRKCKTEIKTINNNISISKLIEINKNNLFETKLFFDLALGGGTESYFFTQLEDLRINFLIIRVQYVVDCHQYKITLFTEKRECFLYIKTFLKLKYILEKLTLKEIIINNLVSYPSTSEILNFIGNMLKKKGVVVSARGHDFHSICPFYTLMNKNIFCGLPQISDCQKCFQNNTFDGEHNYKLVSYAKDMISWRKQWDCFYKETLNEMIVFSKSSYDIFTSTYPILKNKTKIVLHKVSPLRKVEIKKRKNINIGVLGNILSIAKGKNILAQMEKEIEKMDEINLVVIGNYEKNTKKTKVIGTYNRDNLPAILEKNNIDVILISSVWPETFSYTTSEAILMDIPVVCFNLGAPVERIKNYSKGLIVNKIDANIMLHETIKFIKAM